MTLNHEDILLLQCIQPESLKVDDDSFISLISKVSDWDSFLNHCIANRVAPIVFKSLSKFEKKGLIPQQIIVDFQKQYYSSFSKNIVLYDSLKTIVTKWSDEHIETVALKGIHLAEVIYGDIGIRQLSDIDLFVKDQDSLKAAELLLTLGFAYNKNLVKSEFFYDLKDTKHLPMLYKNGVGVEIHTSLIVSDEAFSIPTEDFWKHTENTIISDVSVLTFDPHYLLLHICMHLDEHFVDANIHFVAYVDIVWIIDKFRDKIDWKTFDEMCKKYNCTANAYSQLYLCKKYLQVSLPDFIITKAQKFCTQYYDDYFVSTVACNKNFKPIKKNRNLAELKKIKSFRLKIAFLIDDMFPSRNYMEYRYNLKSKNAIYLFYLVRQLDGIKSLFKYLFKVKSA